LDDKQPFCFEFIYDTVEGKCNLSRCSLKKNIFYGDNINHKYKLWIVRNPKAMNFKHLKLEEGMYASSWSPALTDNTTYLNGGMTQFEIFDKLFWTGNYLNDEKTIKEYLQGVTLTNNKLYISAEVI
jgi:hypothetical protein